MGLHHGVSWTEIQLNNKPKQTPFVCLMVRTMFADPEIKRSKLVVEHSCLWIFPLPTPNVSFR